MEVIMQQDELLWKNYDNIGVLHIPKSLQIETLLESPFASYEQRLFVRDRRYASRCKFQRLTIIQIT